MYIFKNFWQFGLKTENKIVCSPLKCTNKCDIQDVYIVRGSIKLLMTIYLVSLPTFLASSQLCCYYIVDVYVVIHYCDRVWTF